MGKKWGKIKFPMAYKAPKSGIYRQNIGDIAKKISRRLRRRRKPSGGASGGAPAGSLWLPPAPTGGNFAHRSSAQK